MSKLTQEQQVIEDYAVEKFNNNEDALIVVNACAGAGKTHLLVSLSQALNCSEGTYLAYNKSIATEAARKFPKHINCLTTHALAFRNTIKNFGLKIGTFRYKDIKEKITYDQKSEILDTVKHYCLSSIVDFDDYAQEHQLSEFVKKITKKYLDLMNSGKIECTHDFYLKLFHILLHHGELEFPKQDILLIDEAGDLNEVTLEIFKLLPAKIKVAVGDNNQNIYTFNHTINAFDHLQDGQHFSLTKSFRVSKRIASQVETFCQKYLDKDMEFKGIDYDDMSIDNRCFITRTNAGLINQMIELNKQGTPYTLVRRASEIFRVPLMVCFFEYQGTIKDPAYKHLQQDIDEWYENSQLRENFSNPLSYLLDTHDYDYPLVQAIKLVLSKGKSLIFDTYKEAKAHENIKTNLFLSTAHSVKGLEFDEVVVTEDLNNSITDIIQRILIDPEIKLSPEDIEALNLYYVTVSRAKKSLLNAKYL